MAAEPGNLAAPAGSDLSSIIRALKLATTKIFSNIYETFVCLARNIGNIVKRTHGLVKLFV